MYKKKVIISLGLLTILGIGGYNYYKYSYIPGVQAKEGWVTSNSWDCPRDHPIKGNLHSHIYHTPSSPYYSRTNARNSECFDTVTHAQAAGFRAPFR